MTLILGMRAIQQSPGPDLAAAVPAGGVSGKDWMELYVTPHIGRELPGRNTFSNVHYVDLPRDSGGAIKVYPDAQAQWPTSADLSAWARGSVVYHQTHTRLSANNASDVAWSLTPYPGEAAFDNPPPAGTFGIVQGQVDDWILAQAQSYKNALQADSSRKLIKVFHHEPENDVVEQGYSSNVYRMAALKNWARAYNRYVSIWMSLAPWPAGFLGFVPAFMESSMIPGDPKYCGPILDLLDWTPYALGVDAYVKEHEPFSTFEDAIAPAYAEAERRGWNLLIGETGYGTSDPADTTNTPVRANTVAESKAEWLLAMLATCKTPWGARIKGIFLQGNYPPRNPYGDWEAWTARQAASHAAYIAVFNDPYVVGGTGSAAPAPTFPPLHSPGNGPPILTTAPAGSVTATGAMLPGSVDPHGRATSYHFEWGDTGFEATPGLPRLTQQGVDVVDTTTGSSVFCRGAHISVDNNMGSTPNLYKTVKTLLGAKYVTIRVNWGEVEPTRPTGGNPATGTWTTRHWDTAYLAKLTEIMDWCQANDIFFTIRWGHMNRAGLSYFLANNPGAWPEWLYDDSLWTGGDVSVHQAPLPADRAGYGGPYAGTAQGGLNSETAVWMPNTETVISTDGHTWHGDLDKWRTYLLPFCQLIQDMARGYDNCVGYALFQEADIGELNKSANLGTKPLAAEAMMRAQASFYDLLRPSDPHRWQSIRSIGGHTWLGSVDFSHYWGGGGGPAPPDKHFMLEWHWYPSGQGQFLAPYDVPTNTPGDFDQDDVADPTTYTPTLAGGVPQQLYDAVANAKAIAVEWGVPMHIGEYGMNNTVTNVTQFIEDHDEACRRAGVHNVHYNGIATSNDKGLLTVTGTEVYALRPTGAKLRDQLLIPYPGETVAYAHVTPSRSISAASPVQSIAEYLTGLAEGTTYHYRLVASNDLGSTVTIDRSFTTGQQPPPPPPTAVRPEPVGPVLAPTTTTAYRAAPIGPVAEDLGFLPTALGPVQPGRRVIRRRYGVLGCGEYVAVIEPRGGGEELLRLAWSTIHFTRTWCGTAELSVTVDGVTECSAECRNLDAVRPWRHELVFLRDQVEVARGPIIQPVTQGERGTLTGADPSIWLSHRVNHALTTPPGPMDGTSLALAIVHDAMMVDPTPGLVAVYRAPTGIEVAPEMQPYNEYAMDLLTGIDGLAWTVIGRSIYLGPQDMFSGEPICTLRTGDFAGEDNGRPTVTSDGTAQANSWYVNLDQDVAEPNPDDATVAVAIVGSYTDTVASREDGVLERIGRSSSVVTREAADLVAVRNTQLTRNAPRTFTEGTLSRDAPVTMDKLIPGGVIILEDNECFPFSEDVRLVGVTVDATPGDETVKLSFDPLAVPDA